VLPRRTERPGRPDISPLNWKAPLAAATPGARVHGAAFHQGAVVYRASGLPGGRGIYRDGNGGPELVLADTSDSRFLMPFSLGGVLVVQRTSTNTGAGHVDGFAFVTAGRTLQADGHGCAVSPDGRHAAVADSQAREVRLLDLTTGISRTLGPLDAGLDPMFPPVVDVADNGARVLVTDARTPASDASVDVFDVALGTRTRVLGPLAGPSRLTARFSPSGARICVTVMLPGDAPVFRLLELAGQEEPRTVLELRQTQPFSVPCFLDEQTVILLLLLHPHPGASFGPSDVVMVRLDGGVTTALTDHADVQGTLRVHGHTISVDGGREVGLLTRR